MLWEQNPSCVSGFTVNIDYQNYWRILLWRKLLCDKQNCQSIPIDFLRKWGNVINGIFPDIIYQKNSQLEQHVLSCVIRTSGQKKLSVYTLNTLISYFLLTTFLCIFCPEHHQQRYPIAVQIHPKISFKKMKIADSVFMFLLKNTLKLCQPITNGNVVKYTGKKQ